jgi:hypothetical protein
LITSISGGGTVPAKQYEAIREFRLVDPHTGKGTRYVPGDTFDGPVDANPYLLGDDGPDGGGPLIAEKVKTDSKETLT